MSPLFNYKNTNEVPKKVEIIKDNDDILIEISRRERTVFDVLAWLFSSTMVLFSAIGMILDKTEILFVIPYFLVMLILFLPVLASYFTLKETATIRITENELIIKQKRPLFSYYLKTKKENIYCLEYCKVGFNTEPFNSYVTFRSVFKMFQDKVPYLGVKGDPAKGIFKYHDSEVRKWLFEFLTKELKIKN